MASVGGRLFQDQTGTSLATALAKALYTDPADAASLAKLKSQLMNDALDRRRITEATSLLTQQTIGQSQKNKIENYKQGLKIDAANEFANAGLDIVNGNIVIQKSPAAAAATEEPVVVGEPNDAPAPVPMLPNFYPPAPDAAAPGQEPDWKYPVTQYPLRSDEPPVPIVPMPPALEGPPTIPPLYPIPPMPARLNGVPPGLQPMKPLPMPPRLNGPPLELSIPPVADAVSGVPKGLTYYGLQDRPQREQPGMLDNLLSSLGIGGATEPPVVDDVSPLPGEFPGGRQYEPATPDKFITLADVGRALGLGNGQAAAAPAPVPVAAAPEAPVPLPPEYFTPPAALDVQGKPPLPPEYFNQPPAGLELPVPIEEQGPPIAAGANYRNQPVSDLTGAVPPTPAPDMSGVAGVLAQNAPRAVPPPDMSGVAGVLPENAPTSITVPGRAAAPVPPPQASPVTPTTPTVPVEPEIKAAAATVKGADGGASDTPETVQTTHGPMSRESIALLMRYAMVTADSPGAGVQAAQRLLGTLGAVYNPGFGTDAKVTENVASLRAGGGSPGKDSMAAQLGKEPGTGGWEGTGIDAQDSKKINAAMAGMAPGGTITPQLAREFALSYWRNFQQPKMAEVLQKDGSYALEPVPPPPPPPGVPTIEQVYARAGMTAPSTAEIAAAAAAQPAAAADGTTPAAAAGAAGTTPAVAGATPPADAAAGQAKPLTTKAAPKEDLPTGQPASASRIHLEPMLQAERIIESITEEDMAGAEGYWNQFFDRGTGQINLDLALQALPNAKMRSSQAAALAWVMNKLRIDSGGQITGAEIATELRASMPIFGDKKEQLDEKVARRRVAEKGYFREGYGNTKLGAETLARLKQSYGFSLDDEATPAAAPAEAAAATDTAAPVLTKGDIKVDEDDIATTMKETGKTREQVIAALKAKGYQ